MMQRLSIVAVGFTLEIAEILVILLSAMYIFVHFMDRENTKVFIQAIARQVSSLFGNDEAASLKVWEAVSLLLGGEGKKAGIPCKPDTTYSFSLEIKGTANRSMINFREWDKNGKGKKLRTSIHEIHPQKEWTVYKGTFKTSPAAQRLALVVQFWGNESPKPTQLKEKLGDYILLDKIKIEEVKTPLMQHVPVKTASSMKNIVPASVCIAPTSKDKAFVITGFKDLRIDRPAKLPSPVRPKVFSRLS